MDKQKLRRLGLFLLGLLLIQGIVLAYHPELLFKQRGKISKTGLSDEELGFGGKNKKSSGVTDFTVADLIEDIAEGGQFAAEAGGLSASYADAVGYYYGYLFNNGAPESVYAWKKLGQSEDLISAARYAANTQKADFEKNICLNNNCDNKNILFRSTGAATGGNDLSTDFGQKLVVASNDIPSSDTQALGAGAGFSSPNSLSSATRQFNDKVFPQQANLGGLTNNPNNSGTNGGSGAGANGGSGTNGGGGVGSGTNGGGGSGLSQVPLPPSIALFVPAFLAFSFSRKKRLSN